MFLRSGPEHRSPAMLWRQAGSFASGKCPVSLALHGARATPLPARRWLRSSKTTRRTLARGTPTPKMSRALKTASIGLRRRELRPQTRSRIVPWPPSRQGYFAPASRDAILLDGSLPATVGAPLGKKARHFRRLLQNVKQFRGLFLRNLIFEKTILRLSSFPRD